MYSLFHTACLTPTILLTYHCFYKDVYLFSFFGIDVFFPSCDTRPCQLDTFLSHSPSIYIYTRASYVKNSNLRSPTQLERILTFFACVRKRSRRWNESQEDEGTNWQSSCNPVAILFAYFDKCGREDFLRRKMFRVKSDGMGSEGVLIVLVLQYST